MGAVHLDPIEARLLGADSCGNEALHRRGDVVERHRHRIVCRVVPRALSGHAGDTAFGTPSSVVKLHRTSRTGRAQAVRQTTQAGEVLGARNAQLPAPDLTCGGDECRRCHHQAESTVRPGGQPRHLVLRQTAVVVALPIGQRRQGNAVLPGRAVGEIELVSGLGHPSILWTPQNQPKCDGFGRS